MKTIKAGLLAGGLAMAAGSASATSTVTLSQGTFENGSQSISYTLDAATGTANAGSFFMNDTASTDSFLMWCIDIVTTLANPTTFEIDPTPAPLSAAQLERVERVFDANYDGSTPVNAEASAAMSVAVWDAVHDSDFNASLQNGMASDTVGFKVSSPSATVTLANLLLTNAKNYDYSTDSRLWKITQYDATSPAASQDLISVSAIPVPAGVLLIGSAFLCAGAVRARRARREDA